MKEKFENIAFTKSSLDRIETINAILAEYEAEGYDLSLRQLYYQLVARDIIENTQQSYKRIVDLVGNARLAGRVDWNMIVDRGRTRITNNHWTNPAEIVRAAASQFQVDKWEGQKWHVEVMVEKQALEGVLIPVCRRLDVAFSANKGYTSLSMLYEAGKRIAQITSTGKKVLIIYLGDHDPSGIDMTRDIQERLEMFAGQRLKVNRAALNMDQIAVLNPPENPAKTSDSRYNAYIKKFGESSWELDAIEPRQLATLVEEAVLAVRNEALWHGAVARENEMKQELMAFVRAWEESHEEDEEGDET